MADFDRRTVKPAHEQAYIPDPEHRDSLPAEGREVIWSPYWHHHLEKGNIEMVEPAAPDPAPAPAAAPAPKPAPVADLTKKPAAPAAAAQ